MNSPHRFIGDMFKELSLPAVYVEFRNLFDQQGATIQDYVNVIERDSMLSKRIMMLCNHPFFGIMRNAKNLKQAINLIGVMQLHDIVISCLCSRAFSGIPQQIFNTEAFWRYSIACGIASKIIAQSSCIDVTNRFFTLGLLHEIGHIALFVKEPECSAKVCENVGLQNGSITELEREFIGFDYTQLGEEIMRYWSLPKLYQQVAAHHLHPYHADKDYRAAVDVVHLAHLICQSVSSDQHKDLIANNKLSNPIFNTLPDNLDEMIIRGIEMHADTILESLSSTFISTKVVG